MLEQIAKKAKKPYPENTTLIVDCTPTTIHTQDEWEAIIAMVNERLPDFPFREIFLYDNMQQHSHTFHPRRNG